MTPDDILDLRMTHAVRRLALTSTSGLACVVHRGGDAQGLVTELLRLAYLGAQLEHRLTLAAGPRLRAREVAASADIAWRRAPAQAVV